MVTEIDPIRFAAEAGFGHASAFFGGHFPGNPIVPAAMILGFLAARLEGTGQRLRRVERMKFTRPLLPDVPFEVVLEPRGKGARVTFSDARGVFAVASVAITPDHG